MRDKTKQIRVTESLRKQWAWQKVQMLEERTHTQSGRRKSPEDMAIDAFDLKVTEALLALPVGSKFNAQQVQIDLMHEARR